MDKTENAESIDSALAVLQRWQCSTDEIRVLVGSDPGLKKANLILDIDHALRCTFNNGENINGFVRLKNRNGKFNGHSPMDYMLKEGIEGMTYTLKAIRSMTNG